MAAPRDRRPGDDTRDLERRLGQLEMKIDHMQRNMFRLNERVEFLERGGYQPVPTPIPPQPILNNCMLIDALTNRTYVASGNTQMDAEFNVKRACEAVIHASYCSPGKALKCDDNREIPVGQQFACVLRDTLRGASFRAEGRTPVEAEANVRIVCQAGIHGSYCQAPVRCEGFFR